ncbi:MAG: hypothetical protein ABI870_13515 [Rhodanobacter sp.]
MLAGDEAFATDAAGTAIESAATGLAAVVDAAAIDADADVVGVGIEVCASAGIASMTQHSADKPCRPCHRPAASAMVMAVSLS